MGGQSGTSARIPQRNGERVALYLDVENLVWECWQAGEWEEAALLVTGAVAFAGSRGILVRKVTVCDRSLATYLAFPLYELGMQVHLHRGGPDAADMALKARLLHEMPGTVSTVIIASGDGAFATSARELRQRGIRVEALSLADRLSRTLRDSVDKAHAMRIPSHVDLAARTTSMAEEAV